ncbi:head GIN domain-containing protein [Pseudolysinimonas yzui]|uniref:DUF2807 domain-containing protein n=1 Tax=Pseudolysinimonas yzui TaxID=2708254 RepID=A0A8J3GTB3_9MICO|nr:head GIN domain-containing protein [Pseudolysinimonas yzui]GHF25771.1 DUF2807 domain-containing protein [Pseudolysinimonas yzui]
MKPRILALGAAAALVAVALTGCVRVGPMSSSTPEIDAVSAVVLDTSGDLTITEGDPSLTIHAPAGVLELLTAEVHDGVLVLGRRPGIMPFGFAEIRYELTVPSLDSIEINGSGDVDSTVSGDELSIGISGSGDVTVTGVDAEAVELRIVGSGDVELAGDANDFGVEIDGSGDVDADALEVRDATVTISGSGEVDLHVTDTLDVTISGSGTVHHRGGATVQSDISGLGDVESDD